MKRDKIKAVSARFNLVDENVYMIYGPWPKGAQCSAFLNKRKLATRVEPCEKHVSHGSLNRKKGIGFANVCVSLPKELLAGEKLTVFYRLNSKYEKWFSCGSGTIKRTRGIPQLFIDRIVAGSSSLIVSGWAASQGEVKIRCFNELKEPVSAQIRRVKRPDVAAEFPECEIDPYCGFLVLLEKDNGPEITLVFKTEAGAAKLRIGTGNGRLIIRRVFDKAKRGIFVIRHEGLPGFFKRVLAVISKKEETVSYDEWRKHNLPSDEELKEQKEKIFVFSPKISVVAVVNSSLGDCSKAFEKSFLSQTYSESELIYADGSDAKSINKSVDAASGDYIALADSRDVLAPDALYEVVRALNEDPDMEFIYTDEDKIGSDGNSYFDPRMKPDFNLDLLRSMNYIGRLCVFKSSLLKENLRLRDEFGGAKYYDLILRASEMTEHIFHIPKILYHVRCQDASDREKTIEKNDFGDEEKRALREHFKRSGIDAKVYDGPLPGVYRIKYIRPYDPLISIIIPNKDHIEDLDKCLNSVCSKSTYDKYEIIIVENNSDEQKTFEYYDSLEKKNPKVKVVYYKGGFNYSKLNNFGVSFAKGEYMLLLNNDTSMINDDCMEDMLAFCMRKDVGIVGARMFFEDGTIQHAGVVVGFGGLAGHCFLNYKPDDPGYCGRITAAQDYSAVTAACMMVEKSVYDEVGGFCEDLAVAFNDIDFCLKVRRAGYLVVYDPHARLYHYESKSRGADDTPEKIMRFNFECDLFLRRWEDFFSAGDPYYNPNLSLEKQDFSLKRNY